jgi:hypothetical protein
VVTPVTPANTVASQVPAVGTEVRLESHRSVMPAVLDPPVPQLLGNIPNVPASCMAHDGESTNTICRLGVASSRTIVVIGDSHAEMWLPDFEGIAQHENWQVLPLLKSACSPAMWGGATGPADCHAWFRWAKQQLQAIHPDVTVVAGHYSYNGTVDNPTYFQQVTEGMNAVLLASKRASRRVIVLGDIPGRNQQPVDCLLSAHASPANCSEAIAPAQPDITNAVAQLAGYDKVGFIDTTGWFCYDAQCPLVVGNLITYRDDTHVSQIYAAALSGALKAAFDTLSKPSRHV